MGYGLKSFSTPDLHGLFAGVSADRLPLPKNDGEPGEWVEATGDINPCSSGWHDSPTFEALIRGGFLGPLLAIVEHDGESVVAADGFKTAHRRMRYVRDLGWSPELCVEYCQYCAELSEKMLTNDTTKISFASSAEDPVKLLARFVWEKCGSPSEVPAW